MRETRAQAGPGGAPVCTLDPFADGFLRDPFSFHNELREVGPWYGRAVRDLGHGPLRRGARGAAGLGDVLVGGRGGPERLPQGDAVAAAEPAAGGRPAGARRGRAGAVARALSPAAPCAARRDELHPGGRGRLVDRAPGRGAPLRRRRPTSPRPIRCGCSRDAVGIARGRARDQLLRLRRTWRSTRSGRSTSRWRELRQRAEVQGVAAWIAAECAGGTTLRPGRAGRPQVYASRRARATASGDEAALLVRSLLTAGVDTTVGGAGLRAGLPGRAIPGEWRLLRAEPRRWPAPRSRRALRYASPVQHASSAPPRARSQAGGVRGRRRGREGAAVPRLAANRDAGAGRGRGAVRHHPHAAGRARRPRRYGIHACVGAAFARLEGEVLLTALASRVASLAPAGEPRRRLNNTLSGFASLPRSRGTRG